MKEGTIYTVALSETRKNQFHIIGYLKELGEFVSFTTNKFKNEEEPLLDIGSYSKISYTQTEVENEINIGTEILLINRESKENLINFLEEEKSNFSTFKRNTSEKFSIVEVRAIEEIIVKNEKGIVDTYVVVIINGIKEKIKVKDYRWIKYWGHIARENTEEKLNERIKHYITFFNKRKTYMLLYRYKVERSNSNRFKNTKDIYWISSIFYL